MDKLPVLLMPVQAEKFYAKRHRLEFGQTHEGKEWNRPKCDIAKHFSFTTDYDM